jgi:hypothetical protein
VVDGAGSGAGGVVLPGTGTGELAGLRGTVELTHDDSGAVLTLDYDLGGDLGRDLGGDPS